MRLPALVLGLTGLASVLMACSSNEASPPVSMPTPQEKPATREAIPTAVKSKFRSIIGKSKAAVDQVLGPGKKLPAAEWKVGDYKGAGKWGSPSGSQCAHYEYAMPGTEGVIVVYRKDLKASLCFGFDFPDAGRAWRDLVGELGFTPSQAWKVAGTSVNPAGDLPKGWSLKVYNSELLKSSQDLDTSTVFIFNAKAGLKWP